MATTITTDTKSLNTTNDPEKTSETNESTQMKMHDTLSAIAQEIQRFNSSAISSVKSSNANNDIQEKLNHLTNSLRKKNKHIKKLRKDVKIACLIAKTAISTKENETISLTDYLNKARSEAAILFDNNRKKDDVFKMLSVRNQILEDKLDRLSNFIALGYKELQKLTDKPLKESSIDAQLKTIIFYCGQFYADYYNEHEKNAQTEPRKRFLGNKINILESTLAGVVEELKSVKQQNVKYRNENDWLRNSKYSCERCYDNKIINCKSENNLTPYEKVHKRNKAIVGKNVIKKIEMPPPELNLESHFSLVKNLLNEQDNMIKELKHIYNEFTFNNNC